MNILQILPELNVGGVETGVLDLSKYLVKAGHKIVVVSAGGRLVKKLESYGAVHYTLPVHKKSLFNMVRMVAELIKIIDRDNIQIVHARSRVPAWIAYFACRKTRTVFITTCHGYYNKSPFGCVMGWGKFVICPSKIIAKHMQKDFNIPYERIRIIPRNVDLERFKFIPYEKKEKNPYYIIGVVGRITPLKGHIYFLRAMAKVVKEVDRNIRIMIVGEAPKNEYLEELKIFSRRLGLESITEFLPPTDNIPEIMNKLNLLVLSSIKPEAFGRVIIEAQASGVPVIATRLGGAVEIIDDRKTGLLVAPFDSEDMAKAIIRLTQDEKLAQEISRLAYEKVKEKYTLEIFAKNTLKVYEEALSNFKILTIKVGALGDLILFIPTLKIIRKHFSSHYKIYVLVGEEVKEVLLNCPYIDGLIVYDYKGKDKGLAGILRIARIIKRNNFDILVDFQNNYRSHLLGFLGGVPFRYGFNRKAGFLLNKKIEYTKMDKGPLQHQGQILKMLDIEFREEELELWPSNEDQKCIEEFLNSYWVNPSTKIIGINISASPKWQTKNWPLEYFVDLCKGLSKKGLRLVITGTEKDLRLANKLISEISETKPINACGKTSVNQLACLIRSCKVYISADSAPLHIALAVKTPYIALFGPTDPTRHLVLTDKGVLFYKGIPCSPCYKKICKTKECMYLIKPQEVLEAVDKLLK